MSKDRFINNLSGLIKKCEITKNAIIYCRSSTQKQNEYNHNSLEMQTFICRDYCFKNELNVISLISEVCSARKISNQKKLLEIINRNSNINLIIYDASRFSRNILEGIQVLNECKNKNIYIHNVKDNYTTHKYQGYLNFIDGIKNGESESKILSDRIKSSIEHRQIMGEDFGNPSYGYKKHKINGINKFIEDENEQLIIEFATKLYYGCSLKEVDKFMKLLTGEKIKSLFTEPCTSIEYGNFTYNMIAEFFNENNIKYRNDKLWTGTQISNIVNKKRKLSLNDSELLKQKNLKKPNVNL